MKEIGGYLELDTYCLPMRHKEAIALNSGRNCLAYLIEKKNIKKIYLPKFLCASVGDICRKYNVEVEYYSIGIDFMPRALEDTADWTYVVNYYGQLSNSVILKMKKKYSNLVIDNIQAYYQEPINGVDTIYTCRKFLGVTDGAFLYSDVNLDDRLEFDISYDRVKHILGRFERSASEFYSSYIQAEDEFEYMPVMRMSKLTANLLHGIDYDLVCNQRTKNFKYLHSKLGHLNTLDVSIPEGPYMYPLYVKNGAEIRKKLQEKKIFIPTLWPDVFDLCNENELEYDMAKSILPLPVDQRYGLDHMEQIVTEVLKCIY